MRNYRAAFLAAVAVIIILLGALAGLWWHSRTAMPAPKTESQEGGSTMATSVPGSPSATPAPTETPLAPVQISAQRLQSIGVKTGEVQWKLVEDEILTTGNVAVDETKLAYVQTRFSGYIQKVFVDATYQYVHKGQPLFTIYSPDLVATEREYLVAKQNLQQVARSTVPGVTAGAASLVDAAAERLKQWNIPQREIARLESTGQVQQDLEIDSPVSGYVTEREALPNKYAQPDTRLYTVADLSTIWVLAQVFQNDLGRIEAGDPATLTVDTYPGRTFDGRVDFVYPDVDMTTRTARVRLVFPNPDLKLTPGMFVNVDLKVPMGEHVVIPAAGVLQTGTRQIAFVDQGGGNLEPREIQVGARVGDNFIVLKGLKAGENIITSANFLIDSESQLQAALGSFVPPPPGAGAASAMNGPEVNVDFTTEPNPPRKGSNIFRVRLTDAKGAAISGATVTVTFFMPAMPAMGMAAMRTVVNLSEKGGGDYQGSGQLGSGGTWQVTILAKKNGQVVASKQMSVSATGGM
ncbi:MAG TPA: efflux RND transporter periplasmic adaptor subunit [Candidatus Acidoferrales bacterium]|nr:efflux RND transporter periplasmic adaptor subunit [Candidatus Acidoferrales bacterium]